MTSAVSATVLLLNLHLVQPDRLGRVVLQHKLFLLLVVIDLGRDSHLSDALAVLAEANLYQAEGIVDRARLVAGLPHADVAIGRDADTVTPIFTGRRKRVMEDPAKPRVVRIRTRPSRDADPAVTRHLLQRPKERVLPFLDRGVDQDLTLLGRRPSGNADVHDGVGAGRRGAHTHRKSGHPQRHRQSGLVGLRRGWRHIGQKQRGRGRRESRNDPRRRLHTSLHFSGILSRPTSVQPLAPRRKYTSTGAAHSACAGSVAAISILTIAPGADGRLAEAFTRGSFAAVGDPIAVVVPVALSKLNQRTT